MFYTHEALFDQIQTGTEGVMPMKVPSQSITTCQQISKALYRKYEKLNDKSHYKDIKQLWIISIALSNHILAQCCSFCDFSGHGAN